MEVIEGFDLGVWNAFHTHRLAAVDALMVAISVLGCPWLLVLVFAAATGWCLARRRVAAALFLIGSFAGGFVLLLVTQELVGRERPQVVNPLIADPWWRSLLVDPSTRWGFPSQRALLATATYVAVGFLLRDLGRRRLGWLVMAFAFLVGVSRMYAGTCYPTDVFGGWLGGAAWVLLCRWILERLKPAAPAMAAETIAVACAV